MKNIAEGILYKTERLHLHCEKSAIDYIKTVQRQGILLVFFKQIGDDIHIKLHLLWKKWGSVML